MSAVLTSVGQLDADDDLQCREVMADVQQLLDVLRGHVETENTMVHPAIEARYPGALAGITAEHAGHEVAIEQLRHYARTLLTISGKERGAFALFLYRELSSFVAENLEPSATFNLDALATCEHLLSAENASIVATLRAARGASLPVRLLSIPRLRLYRQSRRGQLALYLAALMRKL